MDGVRKAILLNEKSEEVSEKQLNEYFGESYGIFSGRATQRAKLKFTPERARWVANETWHKHQEASFDKNGSYLLEFDYNQDPELIMDILKHGSEVEVIAPASLRKRIKEELQKTLQKY
jgi:predicted DNA-binding transcriptional regulator YafY